MGYGKCTFFAHDFSHLYTTGTKREMRKNSIEFFHIPFLGLNSLSFPHSFSFLHLNSNILPDIFSE